MEELEKKIHSMLELLAIQRYNKHTKKVQTLCLLFYAKDDEEQASRGEEEQGDLENQDGQNKEDPPAGKSANLLLSQEWKTQGLPRNEGSPSFYTRARPLNLITTKRYEVYQPKLALATNLHAE